MAQARENIEAVTTTVEKFDKFYLNTIGNIVSTTVQGFAVSGYFPAKVGNTIKNSKGASSGSYNKVCFYDKDFNFISAIASSGTSDIILTLSNIPENAIYCRAGLDSTNGAVIIDNIGNASQMVNEVVNDVNNLRSSIFCINGVYVKSSSGYIVYSENYISTTFIDIDELNNGSPVVCYFGTATRICAYDLNKNFIGIYNSTETYSNKSINFYLDKSLLPSGTKYIRATANKQDLYKSHIGDIFLDSKYQIHHSIYAKSLTSTRQYAADLFSEVCLSYDYLSCEKWIVTYFPGRNALGNSSSTANLRITGYIGENKTEILEFPAKNAIISGKTATWDDGKNRIILDWSEVGEVLNSIDDSSIILSANCFNTSAQKADKLELLSQIFNIPGTATGRSGYIITNINFYSTNYIDIADITDGDLIGAYFNSTVGIQAFDENKLFIGCYDDGFSSGNAYRKFAFDSTKLPEGTKYIRACCYKESKAISHIGNVYLTDKYAIIPSKFIKAKNYSDVRYASSFILIDLNINLNRYDHVTIQRIPPLSDYGTSETGYIAITGWNNSTLERTFQFKCKDATVNGTICSWNNEYGRLVVDYSVMGYIENVLSEGTNYSLRFELTPLCFNTISKYIASSTADYENIAKAFVTIEYHSSDIKDITVQRVPSKSAALADSSTDYFVFYVWDGEVHSSITTNISDCTVNNGIITYQSNLFSFIFDYNIAGDISRIASTTKLDMSFTEECFIALEEMKRKDLVDKKYANMSSSTFTSALNPSPFTSKKWHKECVEDMGMIYADYGMGGTCYRCYSSTQFSLDYQNSDQTLYPTTDRVMLNQVAKICTDAANNGYYPDIISSCCVLNDCYNSTSDLINKIGTADEAFSITMPTFDLSTASTIERDFTAFFNSTDTEIVSIRNKSCNCMRLVLELLSRRFPKTQMIIWSCQQVTSSSINQEAVTLWNQEQKKITQRLAIKYVDLNAECGINQITASTFLNSDGLHPNIDGQIVYYNYVKEKLNNIVALKNELNKY